MMMQSVHLDTTVPSAYFDDRAPDRLRLTREFWSNRLQDFNAVISDLVAAEIAQTPDEGRRAKILLLIQDIGIVGITPEAEALAKEYVTRGIFPDKYFSDALHVAVATSEGIRNLVSWNFEHLVKLNTRREVNLVNALKGYMPVEILAPPGL